jgi:hypothetical protein
VLAEQPRRRTTSARTPVAPTAKSARKAPATEKAAAKKAPARPARNSA